MAPTIFARVLGARLLCADRLRFGSNSAHTPIPWRPAREAVWDRQFCFTPHQSTVCKQTNASTLANTSVATPAENAHRPRLIVRPDYQALAHKRPTVEEADLFFVYY